MKSEDASAALNALDDSEFMGSHIQVQVNRDSTFFYFWQTGVCQSEYGMNSIILLVMCTENVE